MRHSRILVLLAGAVLLVGGCSLVQRGPKAADGWIAFAWNVGEKRSNYEVYVMRADGSQKTRLTDNPGFDGEVAWSPDGQQIAFASEREGKQVIYVMNADGSEQRRLTSGWYDSAPAWSPDGRRMAFSSERREENSIYVIDADGSNEVRLTQGPNDGVPVWSPDGSRLAFVRKQSSPYGWAESDVYVVELDGGAETQLTGDPGVDAGAVWSPDGKRIAYYGRIGEQRGIYIVDWPEQKVPAKIYECEGCSDPAWSPDGQRIAFGAKNALAVAQADSTQVKFHRESCGFLEGGTFSVMWSPNGDWLAYVGATSLLSECNLYVRRLDGMVRTELVHDVGALAGPRWRPEVAGQR